MRSDEHQLSKERLLLEAVRYLYIKKDKKFLLLVRILRRKGKIKINKILYLLSPILKEHG